MMHKKSRAKWVIFPLFLIAIGIYGYHLYHDKKADQAMPQNIYTVDIGNIEDVVTAQGTLEPKEYVDVGAQVALFHVRVGRAERLQDEAHLGEVGLRLVRRADVRP